MILDKYVFLFIFSLKYSIELWKSSRYKIENWSRLSWRKLSFGFQAKSTPSITKRLKIVKERFNE